MDELDIYKINNGKSKNIKIGELTQDTIDILGLNLKPQNIFIWSPRISEHCEKHKDEYSSVQEYDNLFLKLFRILIILDYILMGIFNI